MLPDPRARNARGFTLIEVMVAIVILAAALAVLFPTLSSTLRHRRLAESRATALLVAQSALAALEADPAAAPRQGVSAGLRWTATLTPAGVEVQGVAAHHAQVAVVAPGDATAVTLATVVLAPTGAP